MAMFAQFVRKMIQADGVRLRGSMRTRRLRKKRWKHFEELYPIYRDMIFMNRHGMTFIEWRMATLQARFNRLKTLKVTKIEKGFCRAWTRSCLNDNESVQCRKPAVGMVQHPHNPELFCAECYEWVLGKHPSYAPLDVRK